MKLFKYLAYVGIASSAAFIVYVMSNKSNDNYSRTARSSDRNPLKRGRSNAGSHTKHDDQSESHSESRAEMMYKNLGMTDEQKRQYEHDYHAVTGNWKKDNPNYELDDEQKLDHQSASLKAVLNEVQYAMYRDAIDNRYS